jgi:uncharacterized protein
MNSTISDGRGTLLDEQSCSSVLEWSSKMRRKIMPNSQNGNQSGGDTSKRGFASMDDDKQRDIASKGGQASGGNFANDPERASEASKKGGQSSGGGNNR